MLEATWFVKKKLMSGFVFLAARNKGQKQSQLAMFVVLPPCLG
jgi:hypothetical protein